MILFVYILSIRNEQNVLSDIVARGKVYKLIFMESKKELRTAIYKTKAIHEQRAKAERLNEKNSEELASIQSMSQVDLINLLTNKYDKIVSKNPEIYLPLNHAISQRIPAIRTETIAKAKSDLKDFLAKGKAELSEDKYSTIFDKGYFNNGFMAPRDIKIVIGPQSDILMMVVTIRAYSLNEESKTLFCGKFPADCQSEIDMKRFKKDALNVLEAIATLKTNVLRISGQKL